MIKKATYCCPNYPFIVLEIFQSSQVFIEILTCIQIKVFDFYWNICLYRYFFIPIKL